MVFSFFSLLVLMASFSLFVMTLAKLSVIWFKEKQKKVFGIITYLLSIIVIHFSSFLCLQLKGELPGFVQPHGVAEFLFLASRLSMFITIPFLSHTLFPLSWNRISQWIFNILGIGFFVISLSGITPNGMNFTIGVYTVLTGLGGYAIVHGFLASHKLPKDRFLKSREFGYATTALISLLASLPFMLASDFTFIPQGVIDDNLYFLPYHSLMVNIGFFVFTWGIKKPWAEEIPIDGENGFNRDEYPSPYEFIVENNLSRREGEIFILLLEDSSYKEISHKLSISMATTKTHIVNLYKKLNVSKKAQLKELLSTIES